MNHHFLSYHGVHKLSPCTRVRVCMTRPPCLSATPSHFLRQRPSAGVRSDLSSRTLCLSLGWREHARQPRHTGWGWFSLRTLVWLVYSSTLFQQSVWHVYPQSHTSHAYFLFYPPNLLTAHDFSLQHSSRAAEQQPWSIDEKVDLNK